MTCFTTLRSLHTVLKEWKHLTAISTLISSEKYFSIRKNVAVVVQIILIFQWSQLQIVWYLFHPLRDHTGTDVDSLSLQISGIRVSGRGPRTHTSVRIPDIQVPSAFWKVLHSAVQSGTLSLFSVLARQLSPTDGRI